MLPSRYQISAAAHRDLPHANPLSVAQMSELVEWATRWHPTTAIDIGCGPGSFSVAVAERGNVNVRAIDLNSEFLKRGKSAALATMIVGDIEFLERPLQEDEGKKFDLVICIGSSGAVGSPRAAIQRCKTLMSDRGTIVFAELVWNTEPSEYFLSYLGIDSEHYWSTSNAEKEFSNCGLSIIYQCEASESSWEIYEQAVLDGRLEFADSLDAEFGESIRSRASSWHENFKKHGRVHFGFSAYVARCAEA